MNNSIRTVNWSSESCKAHEKNQSDSLCRHTVNWEFKATYHSKLVLVQVTIFIDITEIPDLQQLPQTQRFRGQATLSAFDVNCHHIKRTPWRLWTDFCGELINDITPSWTFSEETDWISKVNQWQYIMPMQLLHRKCSTVSHTECKTLNGSRKILKGLLPLQTCNGCTKLRFQKYL